jgi:insertion element IS1 protein InsB
MQPSLKSRTFPFKKRKLILECDELWSFVGSKAEQAWLWLALDLDTCLIVGGAIGPRDKETAEELWYSLPPEYRQQAVCFTDFYQAYARVLPSKRHKAVGKETGKTAHIERFQQHLAATLFPARAEDAVLFEETVQSYWRHLVFHS